MRTAVRRSWERGGLTLAELILALGLLTMVLVFTIGLFTTLLNSSAKSSNQSVGVYFAEQVLEQVAASTTSTHPPPASGSAGIYSLDTKLQSNFFYSLDVATISRETTAPGYKGGYFVTVNVYWWTDDLAKARANQGLQRTSVSRFIYPIGGVP